MYFIYLYINQQQIKIQMKKKYKKKRIERKVRESFLTPFNRDIIVAA